jgi:hypothetical protein
MTDKETFFPNDRPILIFEARRPDPHRFDDPDGIPAQPVNVTYKVFSSTDGSLVSINGSTTVELGEEGSLLYMTAMDEDEDRGALIYVTVPEEVTSLVGGYTLYIQSTYGDGLKITHNQPLKIAEYR